MKQQTNLLTFVFACAFGLISTSAYSMLLFDKAGNSDGGMMIYSRSVVLSPVSCNFYQGYIQLSFAGNMGVVDVTVQDANGFVVYSEQLDTSISKSHIIDTFGFSGNYYLSISNANGNIIKNTDFVVD